MDGTHPSHAVEEDLLPFSQAERADMLVGLPRATGSTHLSNTRKFNANPEQGTFPLIGKKSLELSDSLEPSFHIRECSRPRVLTEQYQPGVDV